MSLIVAGTIRVPADKLEPLRPHMTAMAKASAAEDGCLAFTYAEDVADRGLIRVFELWRDQAALDVHFTQPHLATWRACWPTYGVSDRRLVAYEIASQHPL